MAAHMFPTGPCKLMRGQELFLHDPPHWEKWDSDGTHPTLGLLGEQEKITPLLALAVFPPASLRRL